MRYSLHDIDVHHLADTLHDILLHVGLVDVRQLLDNLFERPANSRQRKALRRKVAHAATLLASQDLLTYGHIFRSVADQDKIALAPHPFVSWSPGDPDDHVSVLKCRIDSSSGTFYEVDTPFFGTYAASCWKSLNLIRSYISIQPVLGQSAPNDNFDAFSKEILFENWPCSNTGDVFPRIPWYAADMAREFLHVAAIYLRIRDHNPELAEGWRGLGMFRQEETKRTPDALMCNTPNVPVLALGIASSRLDISAFHAYCRERNLPYEIWGSMCDPGWYNPHTRSTMVRDKMLRQFGPIMAIPAIQERQ